MASVGASAAQGLQAGWQMGMQADQAEQVRQQREFDRQQREFDRQQRDQEFGLRQKEFDQRQTQYADTQARQQTQDDYKLLNDEHTQLVSERAALEAAGQAPTPEFNDRVIRNRTAYRQHLELRRAPRLAAERSAAQQYVSDMAAGKVDPSTTDPATLYRHVSLALGRTPKGVADAAQGAQMIQQGHETGNEELMLNGVNQLAGPDLQAGVGTETPHGGVALKKQIVKLVPVRDANGVDHPDKVYAIVRTFVRHSKSGKDDDWYDAPLTQNRSSDPNDPPKVIDLANSFEYMGKVGALARVMQQPEFAAKLAEGEKLVGAQTQADVDEMNALGRQHLATAAKGADAQFYANLQRMVRTGEMTQAEADDAWAVRVKIKAPAKAPTGLGATMGAIDARTDLTPEQKTEQKTLATPGQATVKAAGMRGEQQRAARAAKNSGTNAGPLAGPTAVGKDGQPLTGEQFLATLDPADAIMVRRIVQGVADPKNIQARGGERTKYVRWAGQYDPGFNEADFGTAKSTERAFTTGVEGRKLRGFNVALEHLDSMTEAAHALKNGDIPKFNEIANYFAAQTGSAPPKTFAALAQIVGAEVVTSIVSGGGSMRERMEAEGHFNKANSPEQFLGVQKGLKELMAGQLKGLYQQYKAGQGKKDFNDFLTSGGASAARGMGVRFERPPEYGTPAASRQPAGGGVAPMTGSGTPKAVPALPPGFKEF